MAMCRTDDLKMVPELSSADASNDPDVAVGPSSQETSPWGSLPADVLEHALVFLPFPYLFQVRSVCKRWDSLIHCTRFQNSSFRCAVRWGRFYSPRLGWKGGASFTVPWSTYDLHEGKWVTMPHLEFPAVASNSAWNLVAANGGLLCFGTVDARRTLVCNPMTKRWRELPPVSLHLRSPVTSHMVVDEARNSYKILFAGNTAFEKSDERYRTVDMYDSASDTWNAAEKLPPDLILKSGAYNNGFYYCLTRHSITASYGVVTLDLGRLTWSENPLPIPQGFEYYPHIVSCAGRVYLVGGHFELPGNGHMASIGIFELEASTPKWNKVCEYSAAAFLSSTGAIYGCGAHASKIFVVTYAYDMWVAVYNISEGRWDVPIKGNFYDLKDIFGTRFAFQPNVRVCP